MTGPTADDPVDRLVEEMAAAWHDGGRPRAEAFIARLPGLRDEDAVRIVYEEACLRQEAGEEGVSDEVLGRFPQFRSRLALLLDCNRLLRTPPAVDFPDPGDDLGDFRLLAEIGRGAVGRTYLASPGLALGTSPDGAEGHAAGSGGAPLAGAVAAHAHRPALLRAGLARPRPPRPGDALPRRRDPRAGARRAPRGRDPCRAAMQR